MVSPLTLIASVQLGHLTHQTDLEIWLIKFHKGSLKQTLLLVISAGELAGLHRGTGASWTSGSSASAQTPHETVADTAKQGAADRPVQLHMRASEKSSRFRRHTACRRDAVAEAHWSQAAKMTVFMQVQDFVGSAHLLWSDLCCCFSFFKRVRVVESNAVLSLCHIWIFIWTFIWTCMKSEHLKSG